VNIPKGGIAEIDQLIDDFTAMTVHLSHLYRSMQQEIEDQITQLRQKDLKLLAQSRQLAMGEILNNIAHHWRQPINIISLQVANLRDAFDFGELTQEVMVQETDKIIDQIMALSKTIDDFRNFFATQEAVSVFQPAQAVLQAAELMKPIFEADGIIFTLDNHAKASCVGLENGLIQIIKELLTNARDAVLASNRDEKRIRVQTFDDEDTIRIEVEDNGSGVDPAIASSIFEPYVSTKGPAHGTGIGLYMAKTLIERSFGGTIHYEPMSQGSRFVITLPKSSTEA
ncbi:MAG: HAMP domain-containing histidine kinase, partial [Campylobacterales bacterium]